MSTGPIVASISLSEFREAKIENFHASGAADKNILRLQISMDDALFVRSSQSV